MKLDTLHPVIRAVVRCAAETSGLQEKDLLGRRRFQELVHVRHVIFYALMRSKRFTLSRLARYFFVHHASILHACALIKHELKHPGKLDSIKLRGLLDRLDSEIGKFYQETHPLAASTLAKQEVRMHFIPEVPAVLSPAEQADLVKLGYRAHGRYLVDMAHLPPVVEALEVLTPFKGFYDYVWLNPKTKPV